MVRVHEMVGPTPTSPTESEDPPAGGDERRAYSKVVLRGIRIAEAGVRFSLGPPNRKLQSRGSRPASLGDQIVRNFREKSSWRFCILGKEKFSLITEIYQDSVFCIGVDIRREV